MSVELSVSANANIMITRLFRATVPQELHSEFAEKFRAISVPMVQSYSGLVSIEIAGPTQWNPNEFVMISRWESEADLIKFAGERWNEAHIPVGMEKYIAECSVSHYKAISLD